MFIDNRKSTFQDTPIHQEDTDSLLKALQSERATSKATKERLEELNSRIQSISKKLERYQSIDPDKYQELLTQQQRIEEEELIANDRWDELKGTYEKQKRELTTQVQTWQSRHDRLLSQQAIKDAFVAAGGIAESQAIDGEQIAPLDLVSQYFGTRLQVKDDRVVLLDRLGKPETVEGRSKSLTEKMVELKRGSLGYLFRPESNHASFSPSTIGANSKQPTVYTQEQARTGKADLKAVAAGKAFIR
jgi:DNA repair exonuclease SbcCD ATPase subunit